MHHHVSLEDDLDFKSLHRFLTGRAVGYVAAGGGGFGPAHIGVFKAFAERGVTLRYPRRRQRRRRGARWIFDAAQRPRRSTSRTHDVFVTSRGFKRFTFPRYALLDHVPFDEALRRQFRGVCIEDAWRPYFAVATVLDGSGQGPYLIRRGPLWKAVRASGSLPAVLPPVFTDDGRMLVDGGVVDNIPLRSMKALKAGPNLVVHFGHARRAAALRGGLREHPGALGPGPPDAHAVRPAEVAGRAEPDRRAAALPGACTRAPNLLPVGPLDLVLTVPALPGANFMDFDRHFEVFEAAYQWCRDQIDELTEKGNPALAAILATKD